MNFSRYKLVHFDAANWMLFKFRASFLKECFIGAASLGAQVCKQRKQLTHLITWKDMKEEDFDDLVQLYN